MLPKQHILEHRCTAWVQTWGFGMSLMGEQGGEQLHATINALKRRAWGIKKEQDQLKFLMKQHHTQISQALRKHLSTTPTKNLNSTSTAVCLRIMFFYEVSITVCASFELVSN